MQRLHAARFRLPLVAAFSGRTAAWLHGLDLAPCDPVEVTVPARSGVSSRAGVSLRRADLDETDVVLRQGLRATSILRTLSDLAQFLSLVETTVVADMALCARRLSMADLAELADGRAGSKGVARLRRVAELAEPLSESPMETRLRLLLVLAGLPRPQAQVRLQDARGRFLGRPDLFYPAHGLGLEYDGGTHRDSLVEDDRRQNRLLNAGFRLLRFTAADILQTPSTVVAQVRTALCAETSIPAGAGE